jgi:hypothetical protein
VRDQDRYRINMVLILTYGITNKIISNLTISVNENINSSHNYNLYFSVRIKEFGRRMRSQGHLTLPVAQQPLVNQGPLKIEALRSHSDISYSVLFL